MAWPSLWPGPGSNRLDLFYLIDCWILRVQFPKLNKDWRRIRSQQNKFACLLRSTRPILDPSKIFILCPAETRWRSHKRIELLSQFGILILERSQLVSECARLRSRIWANSSFIRSSASSILNECLSSCVWCRLKSVRVFPVILSE